MEKERIAEINSLVMSFIANGRLKEAIETLKEDIDELQDWSLRTRFNQMQTAYNYLLEYLREGTPDPTREAMYKSLTGECLLLNDLISVARLTEHSTAVYCQHRRKYKDLEDLEKIYITLCNNTEKSELASIMHGENRGQDTNIKEEHERLLDTLFSMIWCSTNWSKSNTELIKKMLDDIALNVNDRAIIISAITLSLLKCFEPTKALTLIKATTNEEIVLAVRATVGVIIALQENYDKIGYYPELIAAIESMGDNDATRRYIENAQIQLLFCRETAKIDRKMREEIIPAMLKNPNLSKDKLGIDIIGESIGNEDKNPEWEEWLESSNIKKKIEEMSAWQSEGADLYISTFSQLKRFPFFNEMKNWLRPFSLDIPEITRALPNGAIGKNSLLKNIFSSAVFCNSDKFSFCLTFQSVPKEQIKMLTEELLSNEEENGRYGITPKLMPEEEAQSISNMYIQDLYRFFKLSGFRREFHDPFTTSLNLLESEHLAPLISSPDTLLRIFNHLTNKGYYSEAIDAGRIYEIGIYDGQCEATALFYQELGYCLQKEEFYNEAIDYYTRADIIKPNNLWTLQHVAQCYRLIDNTEEALKYYLMAESISPDSLPLLRQTGECFVALKQYNEAFARFFKLEYLSPNNINALRAIAWCSFITKKEEQARNYYQKIFELPKATFVDYMNAAHVEWVAHNNRLATNLYLKAKEMCGDDIKFLKTFNNDRVTLCEQGVKAHELNLLRDIIM